MLELVKYEFGTSLPRKKIKLFRLDEIKTPLDAIKQKQQTWVHVFKSLFLDSATDLKVFIYQWAIFWHWRRARPSTIQARYSTSFNAKRDFWLDFTPDLVQWSLATLTGPA